MTNTLPSFPVDDVTLNCIEHAMGGAYTVDPDGTHHLVGADYSLSQLLDFLSGYDPEQVVHLSGNIYKYVGGTVYTEHCVIRALIEEIRRLRAGSA